jgi:small subunit ribosomal protein S8e
MLWQGRSVRQSTGGRYRPFRGKRRAEIGSAPTDTHIGEERMRNVKTFGGNRKIRVVRTSIASVADPKSGTIKRAKIETVEQNGANPNYVRRNLLTKGAIIRTEIGRARIVSRPGQDGVINAVLLQ